MKFTTDVKLIAAGAVVLGIGAWWLQKRGADVLSAIDPTNNDNVINHAFTDAYQGITGSNGTLGADLYDITHNGTFNPTSPNNILYPHNDNWSLGTWLYDVSH
jgi:hypothetical protein